MIKPQFFNQSYESPSTRVILVSPMRCIADSVRGVQLNSMSGHSLGEGDEFID